MVAEGISLMASILDIGLFQSFGIIFPFVLVLILGYAALSLSFFKDNHALAWIIAFVFAVMTLFSSTIVAIINRMVPMLVIFFIIIIFCLIGFGIFGVKADGLLSRGDNATIGWWVFYIMLIIIVASILSVVSEKGGVPGPEEPGIQIGPDGEVIEVASAQAPPQQNAFFATLFNAKVLGMILVLLISMFTIQRLASKD